MVEKLQNILAKDEAAIVINPKNRRYYTGLNTSNGILVVTNKFACFFTDFRYITAAKQALSKNIEASLFIGDRANSIKEKLKDSGCKKILFEENSLSYNETIKLKETLHDHEFICGEEKISGFRQIKTQQEIDSIKKAQQITDASFLYICDYIRENKNKNLTEKMIAFALEFHMRQNGSSGLAFPIIVASGQNSALPHAEPTDKIIEDGDFITIDYGASVKDYSSDMTRTVAVGHVSEKQAQIYDIVKKAQQNALDNIKAGISGQKADAYARDIIEKEGYGQYFGHSLGHSIGLSVHEEPLFSPKSTALIPENCVISVEPGIYIEGEFGVRIEDLVVVKQNGVENLTNAPKDIIIL